MKGIIDNTIEELGRLKTHLFFKDGLDISDLFDEHILGVHERFAFEAHVRSFSNDDSNWVIHTTLVTGYRSGLEPERLYKGYVEGKDEGRKAHYKVVRQLKELYFFQRH